VSDQLAALVAAAQAGDREAFDDVFRLTYAETYTLALRLTGNEEDAKDVVQEAYLRAYKGLRRFRGDAAFTTWLYRITANCAVNQVARRSRHRHDDIDESTDVVDATPELNPEAHADTAQLRSRLEGALRDLPPRLRAVVVLRDIYDLPHEAIAAELGISEAAAKVRLHRARRRLREELFAPRGSVGESAHAV